MDRTLLNTARIRANLLAEALCDTVAELRLIEPGDMIGYIRLHQWANIADLVQSSAELSFRDGALTFSCAADFSVGWATTPSVSLDMEFQSEAVSAFFTLYLDRVDSMIELKDVWFATTPASDDAGTDLLAAAVAAARRPVKTRSRSIESDR